MRPATSSKARRGYTLLEAMIVVTIMAVVVAIPVPQYLKAVEQSKLDVAAAKLQAIWCAQRYYYLEYQTYTDLDTLVQAQLLDPSITSPSGPTCYSYMMSPGSASGSTLASAFIATATHNSNGPCSGQAITIDQDGNLQSNLTYPVTSTSGVVTLMPLVPNL